jgi:hypothetical protein
VKSTIDRAEGGERTARIDLMIDQYQRAKHDRLLRQAVTLWRRVQSRRQRLEHDVQPVRIH